MSEKKELKPFLHCPLCGELPPDLATNHGAWTCSSDEEEWPGGFDFATKDEVLQAAPLELDLEGDEIYWIGQKKLYRPHNVEVADMIVEQLGETAYDECGSVEAATEWPDVTQEQKNELDAAIAKLVHAWIHKNDLLPQFFTLTSVEQHSMPERIDPDSLGADPPHGA